MKQHTILGFVIFLGISGFAFWLFSEVSHDILLGLLVGLLPSLFLLRTEKRREAREYRNWLLRNKDACLIEIVDILITTVQHDSRKDNKGEILLKRIKRLQSALLVWASPAVLHAWDEMTNMSPGEMSTEGLIRQGERFLRAIRKDLGHDDASLLPGAVLAAMLKQDDKQMALDACKGDVYD